MGLTNAAANIGCSGCVLFFFFVFSFKGSIGGYGFVPVVAVDVITVVVVGGHCCGSCAVVGGGVVVDDDDNDYGGRI